MKRNLIIGFLALVASVVNAVNTGNESGHGGDPLILEFHHRARFVLETLKAKSMVEKELIDIFQVATDELRVEMTDETLPSTGRVVPDPKRPGKKMVLLDRQKYYVDFFNRFNVDLNLFVAHEVWETKEYDINKEITQHLQFREMDFVNWYYKSFQIPPIGYEKRPDALFFQDVEQEIKLTIDTWAGETAGDLKVQFRDNDEELVLLSVGPSKAKPGTHEVVFRHPANRSGMVGVKLITSKSTTQKYYEFEFRTDIQSANGVLIETKVGTPAPSSSPSPTPSPLPPTPPVMSESGLGKLVAAFNEKVAQEKPWGASYLTEEIVKASIQKKLKDINEAYVGMYQAILAGQIPKGTVLLYHANSDCKAGGMKYFFPRLEVHSGNAGYALAVGTDAKGECK